MDLNKKLEELKPYQLNCNVFDVYSYNGLSMQDLLCQFFTKINDCVGISNKTIDLANWLVNEGLNLEVAKKLDLWLSDGTLESIINNDIFNDINSKINSNIQKVEIIDDTLYKNEEYVYKISKSAKRYPHFGYKTINIIGDSISHGANASDIDNDSFGGILKKSLKSKYNTTNQGFEKILLDMQNETGLMSGFHSVTNFGFNQDINNNTLSLSSYKSLTKGSKLIIKPLKSCKCKVIFQSGKGYGKFKFYLKSKPNDIINVSDAPSIYGKPIFSNELYFRLGDELIVETLENNIVEILGVQYYDNEQDLMVQNYARNGAFLTDLNDSIIDQYCECEILFFGYGHNDVYRHDTIEQFKYKINKFIEYINKYNVYVVVNDFLWHWDENNLFRKELKRLSDECGGVYIPYTEYLYGSGNSNIWINKGFLSDVSHPSKQGHRTIADVIIKKLGLSCSDLNKNTDDILVVCDFENSYNVYQIDNKIIGSITIKADNESLNPGNKICKIFKKPLKNIDIYGFITQGSVSNTGLTIDTNGDVTIWSDSSTYNKSSVSFSFVYDI